MPPKKRTRITYHSNKKNVLAEREVANERLSMTGRACDVFRGLFKSFRERATRVQLEADTAVGLPDA